VARVGVAWSEDGSINWENWWVRRHGHTRTRLPGESDHVSFVNFDLLRNGLPRLATDGDGFLCIDVTQRDYHNAVYWLEYHGFRVEPFPA
jgi:hypothetical protein